MPLTTSMSQEQQLELYVQWPRGGWVGYGRHMLCVSGLFKGLICVGHAAETLHGYCCYSAMLKHNKLFILLSIYFSSQKVTGRENIIKHPPYLGRRERVNLFPPWREMQAELACSTPCLAEASWLGFGFVALD